MTPFGDAMGFVNGKQTDLLRTKRIEKRDIAQTFGRNVNKTIFPLRKFLQSKVLFRSGKRTVDICGGNIATGEAVHLVFHQRNKRRDDEGDTVELQRHELKNERFARTRRHDCEGVMTREERLNCFFLSRAKGGKTEVVVKCGGNVHKQSISLPVACVSSCVLAEMTRLRAKTPALRRADTAFTENLLILSHLLFLCKLPVT